MTRILLTNDDGIHSEGIKVLAEQLQAIDGVELTVVAPDREQSACSHALTLHRPLRMRKLAENWHMVDGTPTDCVNLAVLWMMKDHRPDLVVSGINFGLNLGDDVTYSGTVSATFEGSLLGVPSLAFSQEIGEGFAFAPGARFARRMVESMIADQELKPGLLLNVNFPAGEFQGVSITRLGRRVYKQSIIQKQDPRGRNYFWIAGTPEWESEEGNDHFAIAAGRISVTPLHLDLTDYPTVDASAPLQRRLAELTTDPG
jgi:5'-nucleotidase